jgi:hypothetical protein
VAAEDEPGLRHDLVRGNVVGGVLLGGRVKDLEDGAVRTGITLRRPGKGEGVRGARGLGERAQGSATLGRDSLALGALSGGCDSERVAVTFISNGLR